MKVKNILLASLLLSPLTTFAHGEEAIVPVLIDFVHMIILVIALVTVKFKLKGKIILSACYLLAFVAMTLILFGAIGYPNYLKYMGLINLILFVIPVICLFAAYQGLEKNTEGQRKIPGLQLSRF